MYQNDINQEKDSTANAEFTVVGIGASAGGLEALRELLGSLATDIGMAFVIISHLSPEHKSALVEILQKNTKMQVSEVDEDTHLEPDHVYVISPNHYLSINEGNLKLENPPKGTRIHLPIDYFLSTLAEQKKNRAIGVILSGTGSDGTMGLRAIKAEGGITFAQSEDTSKFSDMPRNAVASGSVDYILSPAMISQKLLDIKPKLEHISRAVDEYEESGKQLALGTILSRLKATTKVDFTHYRRSTLNRRINRRMILRNTDRIEDYAQLLRKDDAEAENLFQDILINVTSFFRDPEAFESLKTNVLPRLLRGRDSSPLRIWVPACSTGEEAYSIAICVLEYLGDSLRDSSVTVFATDVNLTSIAEARQGVYTEDEVEAVSKERLSRFFNQLPTGSWQVRKNVRDVCVFARHNVLGDPPFANMDLISCRNLLIYFDETLQENVMHLFNYALKPSGYLMLGKSESAGSSLFEVVDKSNKIFTKKMTSNRTLTLPAFQPTALQSEPGISNQKQDGGRNFTNILQREADRVILSQYSPPGVVVNDDLDIIQFRGRTAPFLEPASGDATFKIMKMARDPLPIKIRLAVERARKEGRRVRVEGIRVEGDGGAMTCDVEVLPFEVPQGRGRFYLILFEASMNKPESMPIGSEPTLSSVEGEVRMENTRLRGELEETRGYLKSFTEEKEASNEELRSANEELQASYEELQSINEELQTAREELQASNEELRTVNDELAAKNVEFSDLYIYLENLINSTNLPIIVVDKSLRIRRVTPSASRVMNVIPSDVGRPLGDLNLSLKITNLADLARDAIVKQQHMSLEVQDKSGVWYYLGIQLYRTPEGSVEGAIVSLIDIDRLKKAEDSARRLAIVLEQSSDAIIALDLEGKVIAWNRGAELTYGYFEAEALGMNVAKIVPEGYLDEVLVQIRRVAAGELVEPVKTRRLAKSGVTLEVWLTITKQVDELGKVVAVALLERVIK